MSNTNQQAETLAWMGDVEGHLRLIDQTLLPQTFELIDCQDVQSVWEAIKMLRVRGAPAIGIAAAYGVCVGMQQAPQDEDGFFQHLSQTIEYLAGSRPTAAAASFSPRLPPDRTPERESKLPAPSPVSK